MWTLVTYYPLVSPWQRGQDSPPPLDILPGPQRGGDGPAERGPWTSNGVPVLPAMVTDLGGAHLIEPRLGPSCWGLTFILGGMYCYHHPCFANEEKQFREVKPTA